MTMKERYIKIIKNKGNIFKRLRIISILSIILVSSIIPISEGSNGPTSKSGFEHPSMYLNSKEIGFIKEKIKFGQQPWKDAYDKFLNQDVSEAMSTPIQSVTFGGKMPPSGDDNDYWSDTPYLSDGVYDPNADRSDYEAAIKVGNAVRSLGLAYAFTGDSKYADKAIRLINGWTVDPATKMNPKVTKYESFIEVRVSIPGMFYGADLIWNYPGWNNYDKDSFKDWTRKMVEEVKAYELPETRFDHWRFVFLSSGSVITEDTGMLQYVFDKWKANIPLVMTKEGFLPAEAKRTRSLFYSLYAINGMMQTAEIARHQGVDLYNYRTSDGKGLEKLLDYYAPYASDKKEWPYQEIRPDLVEYSLYELAYSFKQKSAYKDVIVKRGRPMHDKRNMGPVTLTHAETIANLDTPNPTTTVITPNPTTTVITPNPTTTVITPNPTTTVITPNPTTTVITPNPTTNNNLGHNKIKVTCYVIKKNGNRVPCKGAS